jgi:protease II
MRDKDRPEMREYLAAERAWYDGQTAPQRGLREELFAELAGRLVPAEESARWRQGLSWYFTRTVAGQQLEQFCRAADPGGADPGGPVEVLLDGNVLLDDPACTGSYAELGVREVSPDGRYLAYSVDFAGDEVYQLRVRDLATGLDLAERIEGTYYGLAWAADSRALLYVVTDAAYRPHQVWRHELGTAPDQDTLVYREDDERFELTVRATRSGAWLLIEAAARAGTSAPNRSLRKNESRARSTTRTMRTGRAGASSTWSRTPGRLSSGWSGRLSRRPGGRHGPRSSGRPRTPGWCAATCSGGTWSWSSATAPRPSCAWWTARPGPGT